MSDNNTTVQYGEVVLCRAQGKTIEWRILKKNEFGVYFPYGFLHRPGDLPAVIHPNGNTEYWENGLRHRVGYKPAVIKRVTEYCMKYQYYVRGVVQTYTQVRQFMNMHQLREKIHAHRKKVYPGITNWRRLCKFTDLINSPEYNHWRYKPDTHLPLQRGRKRNRPTTGGLDDE